MTTPTWLGESYLAAQAVSSFLMLYSESLSRRETSPGETHQTTQATSSSPKPSLWASRPSSGLSNMQDSAEFDTLRREMSERINSEELDRETLEARHGQVWSTEEMQKDYEVLGFLSPFIYVRRKSDMKTGTLTFQHQPRYYFGWKDA